MKQATQPENIKVEFEMTQEIINQALENKLVWNTASYDERTRLPSYCTVCVIALTLRQKFPHASIGMSTFDLAPEEQPHEILLLPDKVLEIRKDFDRNKSVFPTKFSLEIPIELFSKYYDPRPKEN